MRRREFIAGLGGAAAWPLVARAQQPLPVIGFLSVRSAAESADLVAAFRVGLAESSVIEGKDLTIAFHWADGRFEDLSMLATDLVHSRVRAIAAVGSTAAALAASAAASSIPIVFVIGTSPVETGLVTSLSRPGGNVTGVSVLTAEIISKRLQFLHELLPGASAVALMVNPTSPVTEWETNEAEIAARKLGLRLLILNGSNQSEIVRIFAQLARNRDAALVVSADGFFTSQRDKLAALAASHGVPTVYAYREYVRAGGLMSYGASLIDAYRLAGAYAGRVFRGEKPADLPVHQPTKFELVVNLTTAKALGLNIPETLLATADEVIQ